MGEGVIVAVVVKLITSIRRKKRHVEQVWNIILFSHSFNFCGILSLFVVYLTKCFSFKSRSIHSIYLSRWSNIYASIYMAIEGDYLGVRSKTRIFIQIYFQILTERRTAKNSAGTLISLRLTWINKIFYKRYSQLIKQNINTRINMRERKKNERNDEENTKKLEKKRIQVQNLKTNKSSFEAPFANAHFSNLFEFIGSTSEKQCTFP